MKCKKQNSRPPQLPLYAHLAASLAATALLSISCSTAKPPAHAEKEAVTTPASRGAATKGEKGTLPGGENRSLADADGDGVEDSHDKCPHDPEDRDGFADSDGCPDPDNDHDGIADTHDKCPNVPEDKNGVKDDDGCPDRKVRMRTAGVPVRIRRPVGTP